MITIPETLITTLRNAQHVAVLTGAGISAESGLATFRDPTEGLWAKYKPQDLATPDAFRRNPRLVWDWYAYRRELALAAQPNPAHFALTEIEQHVPRFTLLTQNIDGLHHRAGTHNVWELHGSLARFTCFMDSEPVTEWANTGDVPPRCPRCGGPVRPDIVWFGERLPQDALGVAAEAIQTCDVFFSIGTSGQVEPAASFAARALDFGATVVLINLDVTTSAMPPLYRFYAKAGEFLPALVREVWGAGETRR